MAFNLTTVCMKDDPSVDLSDIQRLKLHLDKQRLILHEGMQICRFVVITDYTKEEFEEYDIWDDDPNDVSPMRILTAQGGDVPHPSFHQREVWRNALFSNGDKTMFIDANVIPKGLMHSIMFSSIPETGDPEHTTYDLSPEDEQKIKDNNWSTLNICLDWTETEDTLFLPYFYQHNYNEHADLVAKMFDNTVISKYKTFAHFLEGEYDEFLLPMSPGIVGKYYVSDAEKNNNLNDMWEKNVRQTFPAQWRGLGGDEDAQYIHWEHDYRDMSKQTSLLFIDKNDKDMNLDYYLRLWIL